MQSPDVSQIQPNAPVVALKPIQIGSITIDTPLTLAPMAGQTNHPFRVLCREMGDCGLVCTELISSQAIHYRNAKTLTMFDWRAIEHPFAVQLFGADIGVMAEAARIVVDQGADIVDINMGCWVPKVAKTGAGAALLRDVCTATRVVEAVVNAVNVPVTVKVRSGWDRDHLTAVEFARAAESAGVRAIAVHARTASQGFTGEPDWDMIRQVKQAVKDIPVIGNGDVKTAADAARMFAETGCDAVMIGRAALGNPWVFRQIAHELRTGETLPGSTSSERAWAALRHARLMMETTLMPEIQAIRELRGQLTKYPIGMPGAAEMRASLVRAESLADIEAILEPALVA
ncbi:MAG TPA: tRNA dihydrouridine synthase DusB [Aggregatilineales bacterium]|nr:tRNA dihydrouridine synthase DusB [Aggregatilineales bacterium]